MSLNGWIKLVFGGDEEAKQTRSLPPKGTSWRELVEAKQAANIERQERKRAHYEAKHRHKIELYKRTMVTPETPIRYEED